MHPGAAFHAVPSEREAKAISQSLIARNAEAAATLDRIGDMESRCKSRDDADEKDSRTSAPSRDVNRDASMSSSARSRDARGTGPLGDADAGGAVEEAAPCINVVVKADVQGAADAVAQCVMRQSTKDCPIRILYAGVGDVTESDILRSSATRGIKGGLDDSLIIAFNVRVGARVANQARGKIDIISHALIYKLEDDIAERIASYERSRRPSEATAAVAGVMRAFDGGAIAGCLVQDGAIKVGTMSRVLRFAPDGSSDTREVVYEGKVSSLKQFAKDVRSVSKGSECGVGIQGWSDFMEGDVIECFAVSEGAGANMRKGKAL
jgi:translation initiation factor IF-2